MAEIGGTVALGHVPGVGVAPAAVCKEAGVTRCVCGGMTGMWGVVVCIPIPKVEVVAEVLAEVLVLLGADGCCMDDAAVAVDEATC